MDKNGLEVVVKPADGQKCERCWMFSDSVGHSHEHPTLSAAAKRFNRVIQRSLESGWITDSSRLIIIHV